MPKLVGTGHPQGDRRVLHQVAPLQLTVLRAGGDHRDARKDTEPFQLTHAPTLSRLGLWVRGGGHYRVGLGYGQAVPPYGSRLTSKTVA